MNYIIKDWAGNRLFPTETFKTFDDGWHYIYEHVDDEEEHQDLFVELDD